VLQFGENSNRKNSVITLKVLLQNVFQRYEEA